MREVTNNGDGGNAKLSFDSRSSLMTQLIRGCLGLHSVVNQTGKARGHISSTDNSPDATLGFGKIAPSQLDYIKRPYRARVARELDGKLIGIFIPREITTCLLTSQLPKCATRKCVSRLED